MKMRVTINDQEFDVEIADLKCRPIIATVDGQSLGLAGRFRAGPGRGSIPGCRAGFPNRW